MTENPSLAGPGTSTGIAVRSDALALVAVCLGFFLVMLDVTVVAVALPAIGAGLSGGTGLLQWIIDGYTVMFAALLLGGGSLADRYGARRVYLWGTVVFMAGSVLCAVATTGWALVAARGAQGAGAAALMPSSLSLIRATYPDAARQARAIGILGGLGGVAAALGPLLGGVLVIAAGWPTLFWLNIPVGVLAIVLTRHAVTETPPARAKGMDLAGQLTGFASLICLIGGIIQLGHTHTAAVAAVGAAMLTAGVVLAGVLVRVEGRQPAPMLEPDLFRHRGMRTALLTGFVLNFGFYGQFFLVTLYLQQVRHMSAMLTGVVLAAQACGAIIGSPFGGWSVHRFGPRATTLTGLFCGVVGFLLLATTDAHTGLPFLVTALVVGGFGIDTAMTAVTAHTLRIAPPGQSGIASAMLTTARQVGTAFGVATIVTVGASISAGFAGGMCLAAGCYLGGMALNTRTLHRWRHPDDDGSPGKSTSRSLI